MRATDSAFGFWKLMLLAEVAGMVGLGLSVWQYEWKGAGICIIIVGAAGLLRKMAGRSLVRAWQIAQLGRLSREVFTRPPSYLLSWILRRLGA